MRVLACVLGFLALLCVSSVSARPVALCPHDAGLGTVQFPRSGRTHVVSLATCIDRVAGKAAPSGSGAIRTPDAGFVATVQASGRGKSAKETIWVTDRRTGHARPVFTETEYYKQVGPGDTPGPIELLRFSPDGRWIVFTIDPDSSASIAADGLTLRVVPSAGGSVHELGVALPYPDYTTWCGDRLVFISGRDRVAIHGKRLLVASAPSWRAQPLWKDARLSFSTPACAPDGFSLAVLAQRSSTNAGFFATRWKLWNVGLDGTHRLLDTPPPGYADEAPRWSRDGRALLFVRERNGYGRTMLLHDGQLVGPFARLGYSIGFYGHHDWRLQWSAAAP